ncbi:MAG: hypothetical protein R2724_30965 [Bryobacterales bacterium]
MLEKLLAHPPKGWVGITLGGSEHLFPPAHLSGWTAPCGRAETMSVRSV